jgi:hypothetical protein
MVLPTLKNIESKIKRYESLDPVEFFVYNYMPREKSKQWRIDLHEALNWWKA